MSQVGSIDYPNKRIYLSIDTITEGFDAIQVYRELRELRETNEAHRKFFPLIQAQGNIPKGDSEYTPRFAILLDGARIVPYNISHTLDVSVEIITDDGQSKAACFDRLPLASSTEVNLDFTFPQVEVIRVNTSGGGSGELTAEQVANAVWAHVKAQGLEDRQKIIKGLITALL